MDIKHALIVVLILQDNFLFIDDGPYLDSLEHVIEYYSFISDGLPTMLQTPVPPRPKPSLPDVRQENRTSITFINYPCCSSPPFHDKRIRRC